MAGESLRLVPQAGRTRVHRRGDELLVPARDAGPALERWYRRSAREELTPAAGRGGRPRRHRLRRADHPRPAHPVGVVLGQGPMSFNWRLLLAPAEVVDYVVEHEVAHLEVMDHSPRFWALLESRVPDWRTHAAWLRRYGPTLAL